MTPRPPPFPDPDRPIRLAVCVSGGGTTLQNLLDWITAGRLTAEVVAVIAGRAGIGAIARAEAAGVPVEVVERKGRTTERFSAEVFDRVRAAKADLVVLAGFLSLLLIPSDYEGRVLNVHPSLIPSFCGRGFHGMAVHRAAIEAGAKVSGCTVHFADNEYDNGPIIIQRAVPVLDDDDPDALAARVAEAERSALPDAIGLYAEGRLTIEGRRVRVRPSA